MPEETTENTAESTEEVVEESTEETPAEGAEENAETEGEKPEEEAPKLSHEDALAALTATRTENASWRTKYRELEEKLSGAKSPEEVESIVKQMTTEREASEHNLTVELVATKAGLDEELAEVLTAASAGKTREELEKLAATLAKRMPAEAEEPEELHGGLDPSDAGSDAFDPVAASRKARRRSY